MFITGQNEVLAKVMFLQVCVILFTGEGGSGPGGVHQVHPPEKLEEPPQKIGRTHPPEKLEEPTPLKNWRNPPGPDSPPKKLEEPPGTIPPLGPDSPQDQTPPQDSRLQNKVSDRLVCILLECILVKYCGQYSVAKHYLYSKSI